MAKRKKKVQPKLQKRVKVVLKDKHTEIPENTVVTSILAKEFCLKCKNLDTRRDKDTIIYLMNTLSHVGAMFDIEETDVQGLCTKIREHCKVELKRKMELAMAIGNAKKMKKFNGGK
jgi:hypothetical protein